VENVQTVEALSLVLGGQAGQGIQTIEQILVRVLKQSGFHVFATKEYMSRIRGGSNSISIRVSSQPVTAPVKQMDVFVPLDLAVIDHLKERTGAGTLILGDTDHLDPGISMIHAPISSIAKEAGGKIYENTAASGLLSGVIGADPEILVDTVERQFHTKDKKIISNNRDAALKGFEAGSSLRSEGVIPLRVKPGKDVESRIMMNGAEAIGIGAIAGGCNLVSSYPMSPSTGVLTFMAGQDEQFGIVVEQAEDEIAAVNMAMGAWYAGARAMATTSGGGFALMEEGISLSGVMESPIVIHLAQRPGPGTGLPTRTEQGDLLLALHAGHGEFPRIIYAPGSTTEAFMLARRAFDAADRYQVPVFLLTDQYLMDTYYDIPPLDPGKKQPEKWFIETEPGYKRYRFTGDGISPRGIPGFGEGLVCADSDEHDEEGRITESMEVRTRMMDKRLSKEKAMLKDCLDPVLTGPDDFKNLLVGWGSTKEIVIEALKTSGRNDTAHLHFPQVFPVPPGASRFLEQADRITLVENNATSQFGKILQLFLGSAELDAILKYDGLPFTVEELAERIREIK
jgi:2-oxoglutarate ferredoxin oxidoreductase subunit alpha